MKKILFTSFFICSAIASNAQVPFAVYTPFDFGNGSSQQNVPQPQQRENFQTVNAYYIDPRGALQKIKIKVNVVNQPGIGEQAYVRGYLYPHNNFWCDINLRATAINNLTNDPAVIKENFDWKCTLPNLGTIYF